MVSSPSTQIETGPESLPRLERQELLKLRWQRMTRGFLTLLVLRGASARSSVLASGRPAASPLFRLYLQRGDKEPALGNGDFLGGLEELKALPLKDRR